MPYKTDIQGSIMDTLPLRTNLHRPAGEDVPCDVYTVGTEHQAPITRLKGFSANQLFLTFSGTGVFRPIGQEKWDTIPPHTLLYIPSGFPHEYVPHGREPWSVGYVTYVERLPGALTSWGFGDVPFTRTLRRTDRLYELLERIWSCSGPNFDRWNCIEHFFAFCLELKKQTAPDGVPEASAPARSFRYRDTVVDSAIRFLHDHLQRDLTMTELASYVGYSPKQLNRLFRQAVGTTPLQYLQRIRMHTAALLLHEHPHMTVRETAAHIGMEPVYFTRLFRRAYGVTPSAYKTR